MIKINSGKAKIKDEKTGRVYEIESDDVDFDIVSKSMGPMGLENLHEATIDHPELGVFTWSVFEYPANVKEHRAIDREGLSIIEDFNYQFEEKPEQNNF